VGGTKNHLGPRKKPLLKVPRQNTSGEEEQETCPFEKPKGLNPGKGP